MPPPASASNSRAMSARNCSGATGSDVSRAVPVAAIEMAAPFAATDHIAGAKNSECSAGKSRQGRNEAMIIQTAPAGTPRLAIMMYEHTALCGQFARAFGNDAFEPLAPLELMVYVIAHHDAGWAEFDRDPVTDAKTGLPYNLIETPAEYITVTSRLSPDFNERQHPFCGLMSSMHSWGLYNGRYGLSDMS